MNLAQGFENVGHIIYCDNFYSSPMLFRLLENQGIGATGTVISGRKHMPVEQRPCNLKLQKGDSPHFMKSGSLVSCAWHDTKRLSLLSTVDNNLTVDKRIRAREGEDGYREVEKPVVAEKYNTFMCGVDRMDQKLGTYSYPHKSQKWYHTIFHRLVEVALVNGYIIFQEKNPESNMSPITFRENVIDGLLENFETNRKRGRTSGGPELARLTQRHFLGLYEDKKYKPNCTVCSGVEGKRHQTRYYCKQCHKALCPVPCFERYHSVENYQP